jgi:hypothetical protein
MLFFLPNFEIPAPVYMVRILFLAHQGYNLNAGADESTVNDFDSMSDHISDNGVLI